MSLETKQIFEFGRFRLDVEERTLERLDGAKNGTLPDKTFETLVLLVGRHGHLVTKEDLLNRVWPDTVVEENNLDKRIHHLRRYLGEKPGGGSYIDTVRGRGYRFVGNVRIVEVSGSWLPETHRLQDEDTAHLIKAVAIEPENSRNGLGHIGGEVANPFNRSQSIRQETGHRRLRSVVLATGVAGVVLITALLGYYGFVLKGSAKSPRSIVVLPAAPINPSDRNFFYEVGIADSLINQLSSSEGLRVQPLRAVREFADTPKDPGTVGTELKADYVVTPNYQVVDGRIKVTAQLYNVRSGSVEDSFQSIKASKDVFDAEEAIAADLGSQVMKRLGVSSSRSVKTRGTDNEEAYRLYLQGVYLTDKMGRENQLKAVESLERAVALDPNYARAWAGKALAHRGVAFTRDAQSDEQYQLSREAVNRALAIDPRLSDAYSAMCSNKLHYEFDFAGAERSCKKAIELDPDSSIGHTTYAMFLSCRGRSEEAIEQVRTAIDLEPASYFNQRIYGNSLYFARRHEEAATQFKRVIDLAPSASTYANLIAALEEQGNYDEAFKYLLRSMTVQKTDAATIERVKGAYQSLGWRGVLVERVRSVQLWDTNNFRLAGWYARLGDKEKAFEHLEKAYREHYWAIATIEVEPKFDSLRADARYADLVRRIQQNSSGN